MKKKCIDEKIGKYLHAYEISALNEAKKDLFENHLLKCDDCFHKVKEFEDESILMKKDIIIDECIQTPRRPISFFRGQFSATALMLAAIVVLMIYPSYLGLTTEEASSIKTVDSIMLVAMRSSENNFSVNENNDVVLSLVYSDSVEVSKYCVEIYSENKLLYTVNSFKGFDKYHTGRMLFPKKSFQKGNYQCILKESNSIDSKILQEYSFRVI